MDLRELYQEVVIDHNRHPRNHFSLENPTNVANGFNPLCGDKLTVYLQVEGNIVKEISFLGCGCAISQASASLMTEAIKGKTVQEAHDLFQAFHILLTEETPPAAALDKLMILSGVRAYPARVKCATLAWHTLEAALKQSHEPISTE